MKKTAVYWDADAFLALINEDKLQSEMLGCNTVWVACNKGNLFIVTSTLTTAEVIRKKGTPKLDLSKRSIVSDFFKQDFLIQKPLTREIAELARDVVWDSNIDPKDAVHVATCAYFKIPYFHSFDRNLLSKPEISVNGFIIKPSKPDSNGQYEMPI